MNRVLSLVVILMLATPIGAGADEDYSRTGLYAGLAGTFAIYTKAEDDIEDALGAGAPSIDIDNPLGLNARIGYRLHPRFAAEIQFEWLSDADMSVAGIDAAEIGIWTLTGNAKAFLMTGAFQPFLVAGAGLSHVDLKDTVGLGLSGDADDFSARFGGGFDYYLTPSIALSVDGTYVLPTGDLDGLDYFSLGWGLQLRF